MSSAPIAPEALRTFAAYNRWMNQKIFHLCALMSDAQRRQDRGAFFRSIHGTLNHLLFADLAWLGRFKEGTPRVSRPGADLHPDFTDLWRARRVLDAEIEGWAATVDGAWLARPFRYKSLFGGAELEQPAWLLVLHMFNHQTHHRGQIATLLTQAGLDLGVTDLAAMPLASDAAPGDGE